MPHPRNNIGDRAYLSLRPRKTHKLFIRAHLPHQTPLPDPSLSRRNNRGRKYKQRIPIMNPENAGYAFRMRQKILRPRLNGGHLVHVL